MSNVDDDDPDPGHRYRFKPVLDWPVVEVMEDTAPEVEGNTSLDFLQAVYRCADQPMHRRMRAAVAALPFEHPKLAVTAVVNGEGFGAKLEAARARAANVVSFRNVEVLKEKD
ncbi:MULTISPECIES: hypothetical protein [Bradyrhizobium]|uniref:Uncharacterized protein n=1 Tax=Bradyrhizobium diazoefficiens TaxID=1355477 RepID=A0A810AL44_9BRAD|nr:hypothetical protein [Bradyrhizobium diazoefficiens]MBP1060754.1 hypothetical protein [Bradyrhizobium japonicum]AWO87703.1 hypothetical protein DI395_03400 [Bradyrhizobium diazoefficiens]BBZ90753.1 hypothetical protein F07S3_05860 [Bradyrhizobium diazoefficiens]BCA08739.1 hypothetical protein BDHF08_05860 [Bradyrhizobium diazoefficiens]BCE53075.1 hypothetical protein XF5B_05870 [Bradyrhizobium diazoefficiens]